MSVGLSLNEVAIDDIFKFLKNNNNKFLSFYKLIIFSLKIMIILIYNISRELSPIFVQLVWVTHCLVLINAINSVKILL